MVTRKVDAITRPLINKLSEKDKEIKDLQQKYEDIRDRCDELEQYSRKNSLRISGIPLNSDPNVTDDSFAHVLNVCNEKMKITPPIRREDISNCHRVGSKESPNRPILVKFMNYQIRSRVFMAKKNLKTYNQNREPTRNEAAGNTGTPTLNKIFINEDLCKGRALLSFQARQLKRDDIILDTWTFNGTIMVKDKRNNIHKVTKMSELRKFMPR